VRIALIRHAPVRFSAGRWIWPSDVRNAVYDYNQAPINPAEMPHELLGIVESASVVLASSLARSVHTAELLACGRQVASDSIYDEAELPTPRGRAPILPVSIWFIVLRLLWLLGWAGGTEPREKAELRARIAAERLVRTSQSGGVVVLVGHGIFMALMARALEDMGWCRLDSIPKRPWSACCFVPPDPSEQPGHH
jgi:broad specificity phosphatase PhoE